MEPIWLVLLLMLGLISESALVEPRGNKLNEVADKGQQRLSINNTLELVDVSCKTVTAYFNGTFQNQNNSNLKFNAQFQIKFQISMNNEIFFQIQHWNNTYLDSKEMSFNIYTYSNYTSYYYNKQCYLNQPCWVHQNTKFHVDILAHNSDWFATTLFDFPSPLKDFVLKKAYVQCTNYQEIDNSFANPNLYRFCACCGEYNPNPNMYCPENPWQGKSSF